LKIPWGKLTSAPICIHVRDISVLIVPAELDGANEDGEREAKKRKLARIEAAKMREAERSNRSFIVLFLFSVINVFLGCSFRSVAEE
jgi:hypothetical protein